MFVWNLLLALSWIVLTGVYEPQNLALGLVIGYLMLWLLAVRGFINYSGYVGRVKQVISFLIFFLKELLVANIFMAIESLRPISTVKPGIIGVPLKAKTDAEITLLASLISLTPGSLSMDVSSDRSTLYVHVMYLDRMDAKGVKRSIQEGFEKRVLEILR